MLDRNHSYRATNATGGVRGWDIPPGGGLMPDKAPSQPTDLSVLLQSGLWRQLFGLNSYSFEPPSSNPQAAWTPSPTPSRARYRMWCN